MPKILISLKSKAGGYREFITIYQDKFFPFYFVLVSSF